MIASSPGRAEKLPPPALGRLLSRRGGGGRSGKGGRGGAAGAGFPRSSPMFASSSRRGGGVAGEEGEPSSPKVTCIGQVRMRKKKSKKKSGERVAKPVVSKAKQHQLWRPPPPQPIRCGCSCPLLCNPFAKDGIENGGGGGGGSRRRSIWRRWALPPLRSSYCRRKGEVMDRDPASTLPGLAARECATDRGREEEGEDKEESEEESEEEMETDTKMFVSSATTTPPKNALLLMRCRSAPHNRSSSLATRFWVSPSPAEEAERQIEASGGGGGGGGGEGTKERPKLSNGSVVRDDGEEKKTDNGQQQQQQEEDEDRRSSSSSTPLILTRCKSEPASRSGRLVLPEAAYCFRNAINTNTNSDSRRKSFSPPR